MSFSGPGRGGGRTQVIPYTNDLFWFIFLIFFIVVQFVLGFLCTETHHPWPSTCGQHCTEASCAPDTSSPQPQPLSRETKVSLR